MAGLDGIFSIESIVAHSATRRSLAAVVNDIPYGQMTPDAHSLSEDEKQFTVIVPGCDDFVLSLNPEIGNAIQVTRDGDDLAVEYIYAYPYIPTLRRVESSACHMVEVDDLTVNTVGSGTNYSIAGYGLGTIERHSDAKTIVMRFNSDNQYTALELIATDGKVVYSYDMSDIGVAVAHSNEDGISLPSFTVEGQSADKQPERRWAHDGGESDHVNGPLIRLVISARSALIAACNRHLMLYNSQRSSVAFAISDGDVSYNTGLMAVTLKCDEDWLALAENAPLDPSLQHSFGAFSNSVGRNVGREFTTTPDADTALQQAVVDIITDFTQQYARLKGSATIELTETECHLTSADLTIKASGF